MSVPTLDSIAEAEAEVVKAAMRWYRHCSANGMNADDFDGDSRDEWLACKKLAAALAAFEKATA